MKKVIVTSIIVTVGLFLLLAFQSASASPITQGEYAILLAEKLGLGKDLSADAAIAALVKKEIMPADGFKPGDYMNPVIANEIAQSARKAGKKGLLAPLSDKAVDAIVLSLNEGLELLPPQPPPPPPPPSRNPASPAS
ncbi:MAG TPA: hypothetical protein PKV48_00130 [Thermodesulfobacteriota bacterium]|nr:hypothetical protein [Thermodesulfobacteriota bacterium]